MLTQALMDEHVKIKEGILLLKVARDRIEKNQCPPTAFFEAAIPFFKQYADQYHHYKEEFLMFGFLAQKKEGLLDLEIGSLRHQHEIGRKFLTRVETSLNGYEMKNEIAVTSLLENLAGFCSILSRHIHMEDHLFFPMVEDELTIDEKKRLSEQFSLEEKTLEERHPVKRNLDFLKAMQTIMEETNYG